MTTLTGPGGRRAHTPGSNETDLYVHAGAGGPASDLLHAGFLEGDPDAILACLDLYRPELTATERVRAAARFRRLCVEEDDESN